jgi:hypothetical protein
MSASTRPSPIDACTRTARMAAVAQHLSSVNSPNRRELRDCSIRWNSSRLRLCSRMRRWCPSGRRASCVTCRDCADRRARFLSHRPRLVPTVPIVPLSDCVAAAALRERAVHLAVITRAAVRSARTATAPHPSADRRERPNSEALRRGDDQGSDDEEQFREGIQEKY